MFLIVAQGVIGPVIAAMFMAVWDLFATAREEAAASEG